VTTARAVGIPEPGGPEVLRVIERDVREPGEGEVRIAVRAAAVNPSDTSTRERGVANVPPPWIAGWDASGVVESVGPGVSGPSPGDEVMAVVLPRRAEGGAQIELLVVPAASVVPIPDGATLEQASTLPMNGLTALEGLRLLDLDAGATLAVTGGAGHLASFVIPLAKRRGLRVVADAKPEDEELVRSFGADEVVPRGEVPHGVDAVYDTALLYRAVLPSIREGGGLAVVRGWDGDPVEQGVRVHAVWVGDVVERTDWLHEIREAGLPLRVAATYPPERAADAHRQMDAGGIRGRAVIVF
jgi:NADPH:quinone reductase-like Zn-dependent oxidoreductase